MLKCALISRDDEYRRQVLELVRRPDARARLVLDLSATAEELPREQVARILAASPQVAFIDLGEKSTVGARVVQALGQEAPDLIQVVAGPELPSEELLTVMRGGASEYLPRPLGPDDAEAAFRRVRRKATAMRQDEPTASGKVIALFSAKGGTGVTTTAANLAVAVREITDKPTLLLDLTPALGTAALVLGLQPRYSHLDVIQNFHRMDEELFDSFLEMHESGVAVLSSPPSAGEVTQPTAEQIEELIRFCRGHFAYVIVDAGSDLSGPVGAALYHADERLAVATPELPTLRNLRRALDLLGRASMNGRGGPRVILNQYEEGTGVSVRDVEDALGVEPFQVLVRDPATVVESVNLGRPAVNVRKSRFARGVMRLGDELAGDDRAGPGSEGLFSALLRPFRGSKDSKSKRTSGEES